MTRPRPHLSEVSIRAMGPDPDWTRERRECFLINPDTPTPKSVDSNVWGCLVESEECLGGGVIRPLFWHDWIGMLDAHDGKCLAGPRAAAVSVLYADIETPAHMWVTGLSVQDVHRTGALMGYDVADIGGVSGLSNCGYEGGEVEEARARFGKQLNEHGLFTDIDAAMRCAEYTSLRVPEHAPFYPYGVYVMKEWS